MLGYELLDHVADSVNPALGVLALILPWRRYRGRLGRAALMDLLTLGAVALAYLGQWLDASLHLWPRFGLDYSTHTAVFVAIASSLWQHGQPWRYVAASVGVAYAALMLWQRYHSLMDIVTTAAVTVVAVTTFWLAVAKWVRR